MKGTIIANISLLSHDGNYLENAACCHIDAYFHPLKESYILTDLFWLLQQNDYLCDMQYYNVALCWGLLC